METVSYQTLADEEKGKVNPDSRPANPFTFACPHCRTALRATSASEYRCSLDGTTYRQVGGIWRFLPLTRAAHFQRFMREYETVRQAEGRGSSDPAYYRALPFKDHSGKFSDDWRIRAKSFRTLIEKILRPLEASQEAPLKILDLGAGNGWLSHQLATRGHHVAAIDLLTNPFDGLGAHVHYEVDFVPVQAEFDHLPLTPQQIDLTIFNGSLHYSTDYEITLKEALRVLRHEGRIVIMDSPVYHDGASGRQMVRKRERQFEQAYGFASNALPNENYLTHARLERLSQQLALKWQLFKPFYGWRWALRPWKARLRGHREPAQFLVIVSGGGRL